MTIEEAKLIMQNELDCVLRNEAGKCNRDCANCDLVLPTKDVVLAYEMVIKNLEKDIYKSPIQPKKYCYDFGCPNCKKLIAYEEEGLDFMNKNITSQCPHCGQSIKWSWR